jgi:hypothetical protein
MTKKWYQSKKFMSTMVTIIAMMLNKYLHLGLSQDEMLILVGSLVSYLLVEFGLDTQRQKGSYHPLQDPAVRDALESLISDAYDFTIARADGINTHIQSVKEKVFDGLNHLGVPANILHDSEDFGKEITRIVLKLYREDQKMKEGADLVLSKKQ